MHQRLPDPANPDADVYPTGADWVADYLWPLAAALGEGLRYGTEVVGVARRGRDRVVDAGRDSEPLTVHLRTRDGGEERLIARAVIDASGTWGSPNRWAVTGCSRSASARPPTRSVTASPTSPTRPSATATPESMSWSPAAGTLR